MCLEIKNKDKSCANALAYRISKSNIQIFGFTQNLSLLENYPQKKKTRQNEQRVFRNKTFIQRNAFVETESPALKAGKTPSKVKQEISKQ